MANQVAVELLLKNDTFEARLKKSTQSFDTLIGKGYDVEKALSSAFKNIASKSENLSKDIQTAFNRLNVKTDFVLGFNQTQFNESTNRFKAYFNQISSEGTRSAEEVNRAFVAMNATVQKIQKKALDSQPEKIIRGDTVGYGVSSENEAIAINQKFNESRIAGEKLVYESKIAAEKANLLAYEQYENEAFALNQKFNEARIASNKLVYESKIAAERSNLLAYEQAENEAFAINAKISAEKIQNSKQVASQHIADLNKILQYERQTAEQITLANKNAIMSRLRFAQETNSLETGMAKMRADAITAGDKLRQIPDVTEKIAKNTSVAAEKMNLFGLASIGAILKIQILYSLVNTAMSALGQLPEKMMDSVDKFQSASISNAALIVSMEKGVTDLAGAYREAKQYSDSVQLTMEKISAETGMSGENVTKMNQEFVKQHILINTNIKSQVEGFRTIANAVATITASMNNPDMQVSQETRALLEGNFRPGDTLAKMVNTLDNGKLKEDLAIWKEQGTVIEHLSDLLVGFKAAQGDINSLWVTTKTTLGTIYTQILRDGFTPAFKRIVDSMKSMKDSLLENKDEIVYIMQSTFDAFSIGFSLIEGILMRVGSVISRISQVLDAGGMLLNGPGSAFGNQGSKQRFEGYADRYMKTGDSANSIDEASRKQFSDMAKLIALQMVRNQNKDIVDALKSAGELPVTHGTPPNNLSKLVDTAAQDKALKQAEQYQKKLAEVEKSANAIRIQNLEDTQKYETALTEKDYEFGLISEQAFQAKKLDLQKIALTNEVAFKENILKNYQNILKGAFPSGIEGDKERADIQKRINEATKDLVKTQAQLNVLDVTAQIQYDKYVKDQVIGITKIKEMRLEASKAQIDVDEQLNKLNTTQALSEKLKVIQAQYDLANLALKLIKQMPNNGTGYDQAVEAAAKKAHDLKNEYDLTAKQLSETTFWGGAKSAMEEYAKTATNVGMQVKDAMTQAFKGMEDALVNFVTTGKMDFTSLANSIISDMARIAIRAQITGPLMAAMSGDSGIFAGLKSLFMADGGIVHGGMTAIKSFASGSPNVSSPTLAWVGEGSMNEAVVPLPDGRSIPVDIKGGSGHSQGGVVVNIVNNASNSTATASQRNEGGSNIIDVLIEQVKGSISNDILQGRGSVNTAMTHTFGLNRAAGAY